VAGLCEHGNEPSGFTNGGKFFDQLNNYHFLKKNSIAWTQLSPTNSLFLNLTALIQPQTLYTYTS
jgi:hypothetical protein